MSEYLNYMRHRFSPEVSGSKVIFKACPKLKQTGRGTERGSDLMYTCQKIIVMPNFTVNSKGMKENPTCFEKKKKSIPCYLD